MPYQVSSEETLASEKILAAARLVFVGKASRKGSLKMALGTRMTSESSPGAWPVDDPSKFHLLSWSTEVMLPLQVLALLLQFSFVPSIQMYSTMVLSMGVGILRISSIEVAPVNPLLVSVLKVMTGPLAYSLLSSRSGRKLVASCSCVGVRVDRESAAEFCFQIFLLPFPSVLFGLPRRLWLSPARAILLEPVQG